MNVRTSSRDAMKYVLFTALVLPGCTTRSGTDHDATTNAIDSIAAAALARGPIAGLSIAVMQHDRLVHDRGYGFADLENGVPASERTVYDIASVTKLLTAAAVMRLVDDGRLSLDDDLTALLPTFPNAEQGRRITVRHMLSHTSGLYDYESADTQRRLDHGTQLTEDFVFDLLLDRPLDFEPGSQWSYSNTGFYLLGLIMTRITGDYGTYVREEVAQPLGLMNTFLCDEPSADGQLARGYDGADGSLSPGRLYMPGNLIGDGGMCSTAGDLARLPAALRQRDVVSDVALARMRQPTVLDHGITVDYGLGVRRGSVGGRPLWGHTGGMGTYWAALIDYPDDGVSIAVLVNTDNTTEDALLLEGDVARIVLELGEPVLRDLSLTDADMRAFSGVYGEGADRVRIYADGGRLQRLRADGSAPARSLLYQGERTFGWTLYPLDRFVFHAAGDRILGLSEYYNGVFATYRPVAPE
jgi:D-alanyl-D-alanine carboxypeptidase